MRPPASPSEPGATLLGLRTGDDSPSAGPSCGARSYFTYRLTFWDQIGELVEKYVRKGDPLWVEGQVSWALHTRQLRRQVE